MPFANWGQATKGAGLIQVRALSLCQDSPAPSQRLTSLQDGPKEWAGSQSHGSHPVPLASCQVLGAQRSQFCPTTLGRHEHWPVVLSHWQSEPLQWSRTVPRELQTHSAKGQWERTYLRSSSSSNS